MFSPSDSLPADYWKWGCFIWIRERWLQVYIRYEWNKVIRSTVCALWIFEKLCSFCLGLFWWCQHADPKNKQCQQKKGNCISRMAKKKHVFLFGLICSHGWHLIKRSNSPKHCRTSLNTKNKRSREFVCFSKKCFSSCQLIFIVHFFWQRFILTKCCLSICWQICQNPFSCLPATTKDAALGNTSLSLSSHAKRRYLLQPQQMISSGEKGEHLSEFLENHTPAWD